LLLEMADLSASGIELGLKVCGCRAFAARCGLGHGLGWGQELAPGVEAVFGQPEFFGDNSSRFAAAEPIPDCLQFEGGVELAPSFDGRCFDDGFHGS
jgi:hypothetical protein